MIDITTIVSIIGVGGALGGMLLPIRKRLDRNEGKIDKMNDTLTNLKVDIGVMGEQIGNIEKRIT